MGKKIRDLDFEVSIEMGELAEVVGVKCRVNMR